MKFGTKQTFAGDTETRGTKNIQNTDWGKIRRPGDQDKQVILVWSKKKYSAWLEKKHARRDLYY